MLVLSWNSFVSSSALEMFRRWHSSAHRKLLASSRLNHVMLVMARVCFGFFFSFFLFFFVLVFFWPIIARDFFIGSATSVERIIFQRLLLFQWTRGSNQPFHSFIHPSFLPPGFQSTHPSIRSSWHESYWRRELKDHDCISMLKQVYIGCRHFYYYLIL